MPHGHSWFSLFPALYENAQNLTHLLGWPLNTEGKTWIGHGDVSPQPLMGFALVFLILFAMGLVVKARLKNIDAAVVPEDRLTVRTFVELLVGGTYGMMTEMMGKKAARFFLPLIGTCAFIILFSNGLGLIPGFLPPTDSMNTTLACGLIIFFATHIFGLKENGVAYLKHFMGPIWWLAPLMLVIELISHFVRPASLAIRLAANMTADHMVLTIFIGLVPFVVPVPMYMLGTLVVVVQTLVFCLLSTVYISMAIAHDDH